MPRAAWWGSWRRTTVCWAMSSSPERPTPSTFTAAALGPARACGEAQNRAVNCGQKWMGASRLEHTGPTVVHRDGSLPHCTLDFLLGACVGLEGEHLCGGSTPGHQWAAESEGGPQDRSVLSPTESSPEQTTSSHVATSTVTHMDTINATSVLWSYWLWHGGIELYIGAQE